MSTKAAPRSSSRTGSNRSGRKNRDARMSLIGRRAAIAIAAVAMGLVGLAALATSQTIARRGSDEARERLFELINGERVKAGLNALSLDPELCQAALDHSQDMRANGFVGHRSP